MYRQRMVFWAVLIVVLCSSWTVGLLACGDKLLSMGTGARYHPASILLYRGAAADKESPVTDPALRSALRNAGHTVRLAENPESLATELQRRKFDLVMVDPTEVARREQIDSAPSRPRLVVLPTSRGSKREYIAIVENALTTKRK